MKPAIVLAVFAALFSTSAFATRSIKVDVNGMVCSFCAAAIEKRLKSMSGTKSVYIDLSKKIVALEMKDGHDVALDKVAEEIKNVGYDVVKIEWSEQLSPQLVPEHRESQAQAHGSSMKSLLNGLWQWLTSRH